MAAIAREMGGSRRAQVVAALTLAVSGYLAAGHTGVTATYDLGFWALILGLTARLLRGADPRLWLAVGAVALSVSVGALVGMLAGYSGGWVDTVLMRLVDSALAVPPLSCTFQVRLSDRKSVV